MGRRPIKTIEEGTVVEEPLTQDAAYPSILKRTDCPGKVKFYK
jgi:hypothetical protein